MGADDRQATQTSFWDRLSDAARQSLHAVGAERRHRRGAALFREGDSSESVFVLLEGRLKITKLALDGREVILELRGPGDVLGELAAIDGGNRSATGTFLTPGRALHVSAREFDRLIDHEPAVAAATLRTVAYRVRESADRALEAGKTDAMTRVASRLLQLLADAEPDGAGQHVIKSPLSQQELAAWAGVSRDAVVRALKVARDEGWLVTGRQSFTVTDVDELRRHAAS